ncbi:ribosomal protein S18 [Candidatus Sulcia muelleri SMDSEM]|uniref:Small ribosomal subunit protein bS18 n=1 Tax=Karelsulcia muelleri (strain SMDSEM) TaxID=595499 RepID=C7LKB6_KARMS|nr:ribosomal protein S18 [Candidatus Karelsulcia muelleri SMDSEM]
MDLISESMIKKNEENEENKANETEETENNNEEKKVNEDEDPKTIESFNPQRIYQDPEPDPELDSDSEKEENSLLEGEDSEKGIRFLTPFDVKTKPEKKYCFFLKNKIKYIDYKNPKFLIKFLNERGEILPRRITGTSKKFQKRLTKAIKRCKQIGLLPYITDRLR